MGAANRSDEVGVILDMLREKYSWFNRIMLGVETLVASRDSDIARLQKECADWRRLAEEREDAHTQGYREGRELSELRHKARAEEHVENITRFQSTINALATTNNNLARENEQLRSDLKWFTDREEAIVGPAVRNQVSQFDSANIQRIREWEEEVPKPAGL